MRLRRKSKVIVEFPWRRRGAKGERAKEGKRGFEFEIIYTSRIEEEGAHIPRLHGSQSRDTQAAFNIQGRTLYLRIYGACLLKGRLSCMLCFVAW